MRQHIRCPKGSRRNRVGQCISTTPRRRVIRDILPPSPPSPSFSSNDSSTNSSVFPSPPHFYSPPSFVTPPSISPISPRSYFSLSDDSPIININQEKNENILYEEKNQHQIRRKCPRGSRRNSITGKCMTTTPRHREVREAPPIMVEPRVRLPRNAHNPPAALVPAPIVHRERCPTGSRRNPRTGNCEPVPYRTRRRRVAPAPVAVRRERCPIGTRRNPRTGNCEPTTKRRTAAPAPAVHEPALIVFPYNTDGIVEAYDAYMAMDMPINDPDVLDDPNIIVFYIANAAGIVSNAVLGYRDRINTEYREKTSYLYKCRHADTAFAFFPYQVKLEEPFFSLSLIQNHVVRLHHIEFILRNNHKFWLLQLSSEPPITAAINRKHIRQDENPDLNIDGKPVSVVSGFHCQVNREYLKNHEDPNNPRRIITNPINGDHLIHIWTAKPIRPSSI